MLGGSYLDPVSHLAGLTLQLLHYKLYTATCDIYIILITNEPKECEHIEI